MQTTAIFAVIVFLLGVFFGLSYQQAYKRRLALSEDEKHKKLAKEKNGRSLSTNSCPKVRLTAPVARND